jgi:uncharacterized protein (DUF2461 family)
VTFSGFPQGLALLDEVADFDKAQFAAAKARWDETIIGPLRLLVDDVGERLRADISPTIESVAKINGSISPITRDLRFAKDKTHPYKDHLLLNFWDGPDKKGAPTLRLRIAPREVGFAAGSTFGKSGLELWRQALGSVKVGPELCGLLAVGSLTDRGLRLSEPELKRTPAGYETPNAETAELMRHKTFQARFLQPMLSLPDSAELAIWLAAELSLLSDIHRWLKEYTT